jgi:phospholipase C
MTLKRRQFLARLAGMAGMSGLASMRGWNIDGAIEAAGFDQDERGLPGPSRSGIQHIVVVMMENRSFDHLLGWLPNADGRKRGLRYTDVAGAVHPTFALAPDYTGCGHGDPDHSWEGGRTEYDGGAMDGFLRTAQVGDQYPIGYYVARDRPFFSALARNYTTLDRSFCSILGPTFPNRFFLHAAQTDRLTNDTSFFATMPTIWDALAAAGIEGRYYFGNLPFLLLWGAKYLGILHPYAQFLADAAGGTLPAVSFVDPTFTIDDQHLGNDDHPHADIRAGDAFLAQTFHAVAHGPNWPSTVFIVTYDEWGGFFDHVRPPRAMAPNGVDPDLVHGKALLGFRIPTIVASPWSRGGDGSEDRGDDQGQDRGEGDGPRVKHLVTDHTSILKLIEWRWGLPHLTARDASSDIGNLAEALDFHDPHLEVPPLPMPSVSPPGSCPSGPAPVGTGRGAEEAGAGNEWRRLLRSDLAAGWRIKGV